MLALPLLLMPLLAWPAAPARAASLWEITNEVEPFAQKRGPATCRRGAVCGLVQANAWGIQTQAYCACPGRGVCPQVWDAEDGHSVTHGSNQYKFCQRAPALATCQPGEPAMTDELVSFADEAAGSAHHEFLHCRCPASHQLQQADSEWHETLDGDIIITRKTCLPMPRCEAKQHCKFVTRSPSSSLVQVNCACPQHQTCPSQTDRGVQVQTFGRGSLQSVFCR